MPEGSITLVVPFAWLTPRIKFTSTMPATRLNILMKFVGDETQIICRSKWESLPWLKEGRDRSLYL